MVKTLTSSPLSLLNPISEKHPAGKDIRHTALYDTIQESRLHDDGTKLPEGVWGDAQAKTTDWQKILESCTHILTTQSKDLQVMAWLLESLFFLKGISGLNEGFTSLFDLTEHFWDTLYPRLEKNDQDTRFIPYDWIDYQLPQDLFTLTISEPLRKELPSYTLADWIDASHLDIVSRKQKDAQSFLMTEGRPLLADIVASIHKTPLNFYETLETEVHTTCDFLERMRAFILEKTGQEKPLFFHLRKKLESILDYVASWKSKALQPSSPQVGQKNTEQTFASVTSETLEAQTTEIDSEIVLPVIQENYSLESRKDAYALLERITNFLLEKDPHSPTPYVLRQALSWEHKTLPEVYSEFTSDPQSLMFLMKLLGNNA